LICLPCILACTMLALARGETGNHIQQVGRPARSGPGGEFAVDISALRARAKRVGPYERRRYSL
jgi:hypothetical protein